MGDAADVGVGDDEDDNEGVLTAPALEVSTGVISGVCSGNDPQTTGEEGTDVVPDGNDDSWWLVLLSRSAGEGGIVCSGYI